MILFSLHLIKVCFSLDIDNVSAVGWYDVSAVNHCRCSRVGEN